MYPCRVEGKFRFSEPRYEDIIEVGEDFVDESSSKGKLLILAVGKKKSVKEFFSFVNSAEVFFKKFDKILYLVDWILGRVTGSS